MLEEGRKNLKGICKTFVLALVLAAASDMSN